MRSLHLTAGRLFGGVERSLLTITQLARELHSWSPIVGLCFEGRLSRELQVLEVPVHWLGKVRVRWPWTIWQARRHFHKLLVQERPDVVVCHDCWPHALFAPVARAQHVPLVFFAHGIYQGRHWLERWCRLTPPDIVLGNSKFTLSFIDNVFPAVPREAIHQPVVSAMPKDRQSTRSMIRREMETPEDAVVIVLHSRLERWKGHEPLLDALGLLSGTPGWICWIIGGAQRRREEVYLEQLRHRATALGIDGRVRFLGERLNIPALLVAADIHCQPNSEAEPYGVAFVEAMHAQLPIVTTPWGGALEIVDERCGIFVPPGEAQHLADALLKLIRDRDLRTQLGSYGPENARGVADPITQITKWYTILTNVVQSEKRTRSPNQPYQSVAPRSGLPSASGSTRILASANRNKLRVLHINPGNLYGGVETFLVTLAQCRDLCPEMEPEFAVCVCGRLEEELRQAGVVVHRLGAARFSQPWTVLRGRAALRRLLAVTTRYDVIICHQPWTQALFGGVVRKHGIAYVAYFHNALGGGWPERLARRYRPQLIIAPSRHTLVAVQPLFPEVPGEVLYYPLPAQVTATADLDAGQRMVIRTQFKARPEDTVILQASRIERWKGPDLVLRALGRLRDLPNWRFWLAGGTQRGQERSFFNELKRIAVELNIEDRVQFLGQRTDVPLLMRASDLYCQGNRGEEAFGLSFLEAAYCGLPVVTSDLGAASEWIDPSAGILVAQENVEELAVALRTLLIDPSRRRAMGAYAKDRAIELCDAQRQLHRLSQLLAGSSEYYRQTKPTDVVTKSS
jgi:glycosyltransferase involved in cell wall biosynthesis